MIVTVMLREGFDKLAQALLKVAASLDKVHTSLDDVATRADKLQTTLDRVTDPFNLAIVLVVVSLVYVMLRR